VQCCSSTYQEITVRAGAGDLVLLRCPQCSDQVWARDGVQLDRDDAFAELATAYREVPMQARAARDRAADLTAERQAQREAQREAQRAAAEAARLAGPDTSGLADLLAGWQVLGAAV
jgi:hypothetical protein